MKEPSPKRLVAQMLEAIGVITPGDVDEGACDVRDGKDPNSDTVEAPRPVDDDAPVGRPPVYRNRDLDGARSVDHADDCEGRVVRGDCSLAAGQAARQDFVPHIHPAPGDPVDTGVHRHQETFVNDPP
jgi:hypothetical protein